MFFAFWLSHVPPRRLPAFWDFVTAALAPGGRAVFVDDRPAGAAHEDALAGHPVPAAMRRCGDGSRHRIVKVFHDAPTLAADLSPLGWSARVRTVAGHFTGVAETPEAGAPAPRPLP